MNQTIASVITECRNLSTRVVAKFERVCLGIDFQGGLSSVELGLNPLLSNDCMPSGGKYLRKVLRDLNVNHDDCILDIGCGKGNAMRTMHCFPFKYIHGIEISAKIAKIATQNFRKIGSSRAEVINVDAINYEGYQHYNIFYMYNPFPKQIMENVLTKINIKSKGEILIIYNNPVYHETVVSFGYHKIKEYPDEFGNGIFLYTNFQVKSRVDR